MTHLLVFTALAALAGTPAAAVPAGPHTMQLATCGVRHTLWIEHYVAGLYVAPGKSVHAVPDARQSKSVRLRMVHTKYLPKRIPDKWRSALDSELSDDAMARVDGAYERLRDGDLVSIDYNPAHGIDLRVNGTLLARAPDHRVVDAILAAWTENDPIAAKLEQLVRKHGCAPDVAAFLAGAQRPSRRRG